MPKQGVVSIGLNVDYQKSLNQMMNDFKAKLSTISNEAKKLDFSKDLTKQIGAVDEKIERISSDFKAMFDEINGQKLDASKFEQYQAKITKDFDKVEKSISNVVSQISALDEKVGMLSGADFASSMKAQFDELRESVLSTYQGLEKVFDLTKSSSRFKGGIDSSALSEYKTTLAEVRKAQKEIDNLDFSGSSDDDLFDRLSREEEMLNKQMATYKELKAEMSAVSKGTPQFSALENSLVRAQMAISKTSETIQELDREIATRDLGAGMEDDTLSVINSIKHFDTEIDNFVASTQKMIQANKEAQNSVEQTQTSFNTFQIKNGAIHVPVEVATKSGTLQKQLQETIDKLQEYAQKNSIIAKVKLVLDGGSASGYKKNDDIAKQLKDGQSDPSVDISKAIKKTYVQAVREAEKTAKDSIKAIQAIFDGSPVKITPNKEAFTEDHSAMVNSSLGKIADDATGLNVNQELEKLIGNLKEVSISLSGNENFKFGLDEVTIERITAAIRDMADMIQRAFGVASNDDIAAQWGSIESKFKSVAGEEGKLLKGNKEHKTAIQELAVEYKKYLDMGGKNDLSELTTHKQTIKNIATEYENLGKAAQDATQKQEQIRKKPTSTKTSSEEKEAINAVSRENKKLETQAGKTGTALDNEGKSAQSAAEKFRKLAKEKGAAVYANRELAKAAKETANALEREARARKSGTSKTNKSSKTSSNANSIESLYAEIYATAQKMASLEVDLSGLDPIKDVKRIPKITAQYKELEETYTNLVGAFFKHKDIGNLTAGSIGDLNGIFEGAEKTKGIIEVKQRYEELFDMAKKLANMEVKIAGLDSTKNANQIQELTAQYRELEEVYSNLVGVFFKDKNIGELRAGSFQGLNEIFEGAKKRIDEINAKLKDAQENLERGFGSKAQDAFNKFELKHQGNSNWSQVADDVERLRQSVAGIDSQDKLNEFKQNLSDVALKLNNIGKDNKLGSILGGDRTFKDINEVRANIDSLFASMGKVNEKSIKVKGTDKLTAEVKAANGEIRKMTVSLDSNGFARFVDNGIVQFGRLRSAAEGVFKGIQSMVRIYLSPQDFIRYFRQGFDKVKEIDTAMTELRKVSDASPGDIAAYFDTAATSAKELGSSINEMIGATADWSRMGKSLPDSKELAEVAILYKNVGDNIDVEEATSSLVSTLQGFQMDAKDAIKIVDAFNEVIVRCPLISKCYI